MIKRATSNEPSYLKIENKVDNEIADKEKKIKEKNSFYKSLKIGPLERYKKFGIFPWKMLIHIILLILTIIQCVLIINPTTNYSRAQERGLYNIFIDDSDKLDDDYSRNIYLYSVDELKNHIANSIYKYYNIHEFTLDNVELPPRRPSPILEVAYFDNFQIRQNISEVNDLIPYESRTIKSNLFYKINNSTLGPFDYDNESVKQFLNAVVNFKINYTLFSNYAYLYGDNTECTEWIIMQTFDFSSRSHFICSVDFSNRGCGHITRSISFTENFVNRLFWIHIFVIILATISLILIWRSISYLISLYMRVKFRRKTMIMPNYKSSSDDSIYYNPLLDTLSSEEELKREQKKAEETTIFEEGRDPFVKESERKKSLFGKEYYDAINKANKIKREPKKHLQVLQLWSVLGLIGNLIQIIGSGLALSKSSDVTTNITVLIGSGCLFACINMGKYIEYHKDYAIVYETLRQSFPVVIRYLIGVFPIFLGFLFFSVSVFWRSERFASVSTASISLFALIQADAILDSFRDLSGIRFFLGQIFLYLFCITFIIIVWNIFISIIEEAYVVVKLRNKTSWIYDYVKIQPKYVQMKIHSQPSLEFTRKYFSNIKKTSELLKKKISKSLKTSDILNNKTKELSIAPSTPSARNISLQTLKPSSIFSGKREARHWNLNVESIPENDEFLLPKQIISKKVTFKESLKNTTQELQQRQIKNKEKHIENLFTGLEKRLENIQNMVIDLSQNKKSIPIIVRLRKDKIKKSILNKVNLIENKANELRRVWIAD